MRSISLISALLTASAAGVALPDQQKTFQKLSTGQVLQGILTTPNIIPESSKRVLIAKLEDAGYIKKNRKRDPQNASGSSLISTASIAGILGVTQAVFESMFPLPARAPKSLVPEAADSKSPRFEGALRRKIRYGPYRVPATSEKNIESEMLHVQGMGNTWKMNARKPCDYDCTILSHEMSLEFADGAPAENNNGVWFHHSTLVNAGPSAKTPMCGPTPIENIGLVGNEKSAVDFAIADPTAVKSGYKLTWGDTLSLSTQLMNLEDKEKWVWVTITFDYVDGPRPDYMPSRFVWKSLSTQTAGACVGDYHNPFGPSNITDDMQPKRMKFAESSIPISAGVEGLILMTGGHMHDGGTDIEILQNGKVICKSVASYRKGAEGMGGHGHNKRQTAAGAIMGGNHTNTEIEHIAGQSRCRFPKGIPIKESDKMWIRANYDFNLHPGMKNAKGELDEIMGIVGTVIASKNP